MTSWITSTLPPAREYTPQLFFFAVPWWLQSHSLTHTHTHTHTHTPQTPSLRDASFRSMWADFEWENKVSVNTSIQNLHEFVKHISRQTNMRILTPIDALPATVSFLAANLYARSTFGEFTFSTSGILPTRLFPSATPSPLPSFSHPQISPPSLLSQAKTRW